MLLCIPKKNTKEKNKVFVKREMTADVLATTFDTIDGDTSGLINSNVEWMHKII